MQPIGAAHRSRFKTALANRILSDPALGGEPNLLNKKHLIIVMLVAILLTPSALFAQTTKVPDPAFTTDCDAYIRKVMTQVPEIPSVAIVVIKDDQPIFLRAY